MIMYRMRMCKLSIYVAARCLALAFTLAVSLCWFRVLGLSLHPASEPVLGRKTVKVKSFQFAQLVEESLGV